VAVTPRHTQRRIEPVNRDKEGDAMNESLPVRLRDVDEQNALIVRRQAADRIELYELTIVSLCERETTMRSKLEALRDRAPHEPLNVDISDYSDEFCTGFLAGQSHALDQVDIKGLP
jgi:hypothetical protein